MAGKSRYSVRFVRDGYIRFRYAVDAEEMLVLKCVERSAVVVSTSACLELVSGAMMASSSRWTENPPDPLRTACGFQKTAGAKTNKHLRFGMDLSGLKWLLGKMCDILYLVDPAVLRGSTRRSQGMSYSMSPTTPTSCVPCCRISERHPGKTARGCSC